MSSQFSILGFFVILGYFTMDIMGSDEPPYPKAVYDTATILITSVSPPTVRGTKWCGYDVAARSYEKLGEAIETDKCCRQWHNCDDFIAPLGEKYEIHNTVNYKILHCYCNNAFHRCLKDVEGMEAATAAQIGMAYFDIIGPKCLRKVYYEPTCDVSYYDELGNKYPNNGGTEYFCPKLAPSQPW
uniref:phospholipase A2 n=1 Tax=Orancistrocerus drewseni TaxID=529024 RepID=B2ZP62_ORADR|nr:phospholipase A2 [Orancistrocerus drewseni]